MSKDLGFDLPESFRDKLRGISRSESIRRIFEYFNLEVEDDKILELSDKKNKYYAESIDDFSLIMFFRHLSSANNSMAVSI